MIDEIFEMIMKEARARPGTDLARKIIMVLLEVADKVTSAQENLRKFERRHPHHEE